MNNNEKELNNDFENLTLDELLEQLDKYIEEQKTKKTLLPIAKTVYIVKALSSQDEDYLKSSLFRKYTQLLRRLFELMLKKSSPENRTTGLDFNTLSREISLLDIHELSKVLLEVTYETFKTSDNITIKCDACNKEYTTDDLNNMKIRYSDFDNINNTWDKDIPFNEYIYEFTPENFSIRLKNSDVIVLKPTFNLCIPTLYDYLQKQHIVEKYRKDQTNDLIPGLQISTGFTEQSLLDLFPVKRDTVFTIVKSIKLRLYDTKNDRTLREEIIEDNNKIIQILDRLPMSILDEIREKHAEIFGNYIPVYKTTIKCENCGADIDLVIQPELNLIDRILT
jgi:hypothetical protein